MALKNYQNESDQWVVTRWIKWSDGLAFEEIYLRKKQSIYNYVFRMTKNINLSEEIVNDVFMVLWNSPQKFENVDINTYLIGIARNLTFNQLRDNATSGKHINIEDLDLELTENISETFEYREYQDLLVLDDQVFKQRKGQK